MDHKSLALIVILLSVAPTRAELVSLEWHTREPFLDGKTFGDTGAYERLMGVARFAVDPTHARNLHIIDLNHAPRNSRGLVEFSSDVYLLRPRDLSRGNGALLYDVNNRGNKLALGMFNDASNHNHPSRLEHAGNGFLFRRGYTLLWCGWIGELLPGNHRLLLRTPIAQDKGEPIKGLVRYEMVSDRVVETMPLSRREGHGSYPPTLRGLKEGTLTWRMRENDERVEIPRQQWSLEFVPLPSVSQGVPGTLQQIRLKLAGGFRPGYIYELICECSGPIVQGLGFAAVRDLVSFLKYQHDAKNPLARDKKSIISRAHGFGVSQSGRFLRHFLYQGFNVDEQGRKVFDGLIPHVAGGGLGSFNHRFAQPTRHNGQHEEHLYPADVFPFTYGPSDDDFVTEEGILRRRGQPDAILRRLADEDPRFLPKIFHTQSAAEYWHRSGSLVHTNTLGTEDALIPDNVRIFAFGGTQHGPASDPPGRGSADQLLNPADYRPFLRALLDALDAWARDETPPPASVYPRIQHGTLVHWKQRTTGFPLLPGVRYPEVIQQPSALDLGPHFRSRGISTREPPKILGHYRVLVPRSDSDGNDLGCLLPLEVKVPLATYTGWNLRRREVGAEAMLASLVGSYLPFPLNESQRSSLGDPRPSIVQRYKTFAGYRKQWEIAREELVRGRYLLPEDAERAANKLEKLRSLFP